MYLRYAFRICCHGHAVTDMSRSVCLTAQLSRDCCHAQVQSRIAAVAELPSEDPSCRAPVSQAACAMYIPQCSMGALCSTTCAHAFKTCSPKFLDVARLPLRSPKSPSILHFAPRSPLIYTLFATREHKRSMGYSAD